MRAFRALPLVLLLTGCMPPPDPGQEPLLDLGARGCDASPALAAAVPLDATVVREVTAKATVEPGSACLRGADGKPSLYVAFRLIRKQPAADNLLVASLPTGRSMMAPRLILLDEAGTPTREIGAEGFNFRGAGLATLVRLRAGERYAVVASNPAVVGQAQSRLVASAIPTTVMVGLAAVTVYAGSEQKSEGFMTHNGLVTLTMSTEPPPR